MTQINCPDCGRPGYFKREDGHFVCRGCMAWYTDKELKHREAVAVFLWLLALGAGLVVFLGLAWTLKGGF